MTNIIQNPIITRTEQTGYPERVITPYGFEHFERCEVGGCRKAAFIKHEGTLYCAECAKEGGVI